MRNIDLAEIISGACRANYGRSIYFLLHEGQVVYVGQSKNVLGRFNEHIQWKTFDSYFVLEVEDDDSLDDVEMHFVMKFNPKYNVAKMVPRGFVKATGETLFERVIARLEAGQTLYSACKAEGFHSGNFSQRKDYIAWKNKKQVA